MDVYICDDNFKVIDILDSFVSVIWTERYSVAGEIEINAPANTKNTKLLVEGNWVRSNESEDIMLIETVNLKNGVIKASGPSLLEFLKQRFFRHTWSDVQGWALGVPRPMYQIIRLVLEGTINPATFMTGGGVLTAAQGALEQIPEFVISSRIPEGFNDTYTLTVPFGDVYSVVTGLASSDNLGIKLRPDPNGGPGMIFSLYRGVDRTSAQKVKIPIVLSPKLGNLTDVETLYDLQKYKNVCWVWPAGITSQSQIGVAYVDGAQTAKRFNRRTMAITSQINVADYPAEDLATVLKIEGLNALINNNYVRMVDGKMGLQGEYVYGTDYGLGDYIELNSPDGETSSYAQITEYIRSQDVNGKSGYPTLTVV